MKGTEMKHAEVPAALDLVVEEVGKESQRIRDAGGEPLKAGKLLMRYNISWRN